MSKFNTIFNKLVNEQAYVGSLSFKQITKTVTQIDTRITGVLLQTFREMLKAEDFKGIIVIDEDGQITVYCLTSEVNEVVDAIEQGMEDFVNDDFVNALDQ